MQITQPLLPNWCGFSNLKTNNSKFFHLAMIIIPLLLFGSSSVLHSQDTEMFQAPAKTGENHLDSVKLGVKDLPKLKKLVSEEGTEPEYSFLWIFSDAGFINGTPDSSLLYRYSPDKAISQTSASVHATGLYSDDGKRPPKLQIDSIDIPTVLNPDKYVPVLTVEDDLLNVQRNHLNMVEGDSTYWIVSFRNPTKTEVWSGQLYLFYESPIDEVYPVEYTSERVPAVVPTKEVAQLEHLNSLVFYPDSQVDSVTYSIDTIKGANPIANVYNKALVWNIDSLMPQEEKRVFVQFENDPNLQSKFNSQAKARVKFLSMFVSGFTQEYTGLDTADFELVTNYGLGSFASNLIELYSDDTEPNSNPANVPIGELINSFDTGSGLGGQILDVLEGEIFAARGHDPNQILLDACKCPVGSNGEEKIIVTVDFVNTGNAPTKDIFIEINIPEGVNINSIAEFPLETKPALEASFNPADYIKMSIDEANRTLTWHLDGFELKPTAEKGVGHSSTEGQIIFAMQTELGVAASNIDEMQACIRFLEGDDPVCTLPATVNPIISNPEKPAAQHEYLTCQECRKVPPPPVPTPAEAMPWWIWLIILLALGIVAWAVYDNL